MKNTILKTVGAAALAILMMAMFAQIPAFAQEVKTDKLQNDELTSENSSEQDGGERIVGTWDVQVTIRNCQTGAAIRTFPSVTSYMSGGTFVESTSGTPQALKTPGQGVWSQLSRQTYRLAFKSFNFDAGNNFTGWQIVRQQVTLNRRADESESAGTVQVYAPNGNLVFTGCSTATAVRFE